MRARYRGLALAYSDNSASPASMIHISIRLTFPIWILFATLTTALFPAHAQSSQDKPLSGQTSDSAKIAAASNGFVNLPLSFEANQGQADPRVRFVSRGNGYSLFLTDSAAVLTLTRREANSQLKLDTSRTAEPQGTDVLRMEFAGRTQKSAVTGENALPGKANYFLGNDPSKWISNVPTFARVKYEDIYPGVNLIYYGNQRQLEYDLVVIPGADPKLVRLHFTGAEKLKLELNGDLTVVARNGEVLFHKPVVYQVENGQRHSVDGRFALLAKDKVGFTLGDYDHTRELVIDPTLSYSTYLGGSGYHIPAGPDCCGDYGNAIAVDSEGNAYVTGKTGSSDFPAPTGAVQGTNMDAHSNGNAFVSKINSTGTALMYSTYLGGTGNYWYGDAGQGIAVDALGDAYVTGSAGSKNFPFTSGAYQTTNKANPNLGYTGFVTKLNPTGTALIYSTFVGGSGLANCCGPGYGDAPQGLALDPSGEVYIAGTTYSPDFPVTGGAYQKVNNAKAIGKSNVFVAKLNAEGSGLIYATYLGGSGYSENCCYFFSGGDYGTGIAIDGTGSAYVTGYAHSLNFPVTPGAYQPKNRAVSSLNGTGAANYNAFVTKFNPTGTELVYSTYLGGIGNPYYGDQAAGIAVDPECYAYVTGQAASTDFPTTSGVFQPKDNANVYQINAFVTKFNTTGTGLEYSTYLGGTVPGRAFGDYTTGIQVDAAGQAYVVGTAQSPNYPTTTATAYQPTNLQTADAGADYFSGNAFVTELNAEGSGLVYSSFLGGTGSADGGNGGDTGLAIALDMAGNAYITGHTLSANFPILPKSGAFQSTMPAAAAGDQDSGNAFVAMFDIGAGTMLSSTSTSIIPDANPVAAEVKLTLTAYVQQSTACGFPPTGTVTFTIDGGAPIKITLDDTGHAAYATSTLAMGQHAVTVSYSGDAKYKPSSASLTEVVVAPPAMISVNSGNGQSGVYGAAFSLPLQVIVKDAKGGVAPGVPVTFTGTGVKFASSTVMTNESGIASAIATAAATGKLTAAASVTGITETAPFTLTGRKAMLTVTAKNVSVPYGQNIPTLTDTITGLVNGDSSKVVTGTAKETTTAVKGAKVGTYPIDITQGTLAAENYTFKFVNGILTVTSLGTARTPTFSPAAKTYTSAQSVKLADATSGAVIYYTTNGATPTTSSAKYSAAIPVTVTTTIKAIAVAPGYSNSAVASATYTITPLAATPVFSPVAGTYTSAQSVKITDATSGATIYYTTNGTTPTTSSTKYTKAIPVSTTETIKAIAVATGHANSTVASAPYTIH